MDKANPPGLNQTFLYRYSEGLRLKKVDEIPETAKLRKEMHEEHLGTLVMRSPEVLLSDLFGESATYLYSDRGGFWGGFDQCWLLDSGEVVALEMKRTRAKLKYTFIDKKGAPKFWHDVQELLDFLSDPIKTNFSKRYLQGRDKIKDMEFLHFCSLHYKKSWRQLLAKYPKVKSENGHEDLNINKLKAVTSNRLNLSTSRLQHYFNIGFRKSDQDSELIDAKIKEMSVEHPYPWRLEADINPWFGKDALWVIIAAPELKDSDLHKSYADWPERVEKKGLSPESLSRFLFLKWEIYSDQSGAQYLKTSLRSVKPALEGDDLL